MFTTKIRPLKKIVEGRTRIRGADVLVTVSKRGYRFAMNAGADFRADDEWTEFSDSLQAFVKEAKQIVSEM